jgi:integrase/recombinase XerD
MILKDICHRFITFCQATRKLSDHTIRAYKKDLEICCEHLGANTPIAAVDRKSLKQFIHQLCQSPASMSSNKRRIACIKAMFRWMELEDHITVNPFHKIEIKLKLPRKLPRNIPNADLVELIEKARSELGLQKQQNYQKQRLQNYIVSKRDLNKLTTIVVLELLISTGIRVGELVSIEEQHIYWHEGRIRILGKGQRERYVFLPDDELVTLLTSYISLKAITEPQYQQNGAMLLVNSRGKPASTQYIRKLLKTLVHKTTIHRNITPHMYRHSAACQLLEADVDIRFVQRLLGHHSISTTEIYTHVNDRVLQDKITKAGVRGSIC